MHSAFDPHSPQARAVAHLWWWMFGVGGAVWIAVTIAMLVAITRRGDTSYDARKSALTAFVAGTGIVLASFLAYDFAIGRDLARRGAPALTIPTTRVHGVCPRRIRAPIASPFGQKRLASDWLMTLSSPAMIGSRATSSAPCFVILPCGGGADATVARAKVRPRTRGMPAVAK